MLTWYKNKQILCYLMKYVIIGFNVTVLPLVKECFRKLQNNYKKEILVYLNMPTVLILGNLLMQTNATLEVFFCPFTTLEPS